MKRLIVALGLFSAFHSTSSLAQDPLAPVVIRLDRMYMSGANADANTYVPGLFGPIGSTQDLVGGVIGGALIGAGDKGVGRDYASLVSNVPNVNVEQALADAFACVGLREEQRPCREVRIIAPGITEISPAARGGGDLALIGVTLNFSIYKNLFQAFAVVNFTTNDYERAPSQPIVVMYEEYAPAEIDETPWYKDPEDVSESDVRRHAAAREYWLTGSPSKLEATTLGAITDVAGITSMMLAAARSTGAIPDLEAWVLQWPLASELAAAGTRECSGRRCRGVYYLKTTPERDWIIDTTFPLTLEVVRSLAPTFAAGKPRGNVGTE
jgi:hypothetical protein